MAVVGSGLGEFHSNVAINKHLIDLHNKEQRGGVLYCEEYPGNRRVEFDNCQSFSLLKNRGCFGSSTYEMIVESRYAAMCDKIITLQKAKTPKVSYFDIESSDWWRTIPAEIIPVSGGIYSDESWKKAQLEREMLVTGKVLSDLQLRNTTDETGMLEIILNKRQQYCGEIDDTLNISVVLLADFDKDGIAELFLEGYRMDKSDNCSLGSGNALGASFSVVVKKSSPNNAPVVLPSS